jgi:hypothetical protein
MLDAHAPELRFSGIVEEGAHKVEVTVVQVLRGGWFLHTGWDVLHHLYGNPIVLCVPDSSLGCAITDPVIALWCFVGAPSVHDLFRGKGRGHQASGDTATEPDVRP